jgi:dihydroorotate dehydrogenase (fumarate)
MSPGEPPQLYINPPLVNSANPWATTLEDLTELFLCKSTGAVTTRTSLIDGFDHHDAKHQYLFFDPANAVSSKGAELGERTASASLNNLGYSPITLEKYLSFISSIAKEYPESKKPLIISVTGLPEEVSQCCDMITVASKAVSMPLAMEINLSCPNIPNSPPPAYDGDSLKRYLDLLSSTPEIPIGVKTPPYTHGNDFNTLISALAASSQRSKISFITATNTLGSCLVLTGTGHVGYAPELPGSGIGGMAGPPLHPLALGNVATIRRLLDDHEDLKRIRIIGVGGVGDADGYRRMKSVGAYAVGVGTALGREGVDVFGKIESELGGNW